MIKVYDPLYSAGSQKGTVLVGGCFDVLHYGHVIFFKEAKALGKYLVVALENDDSIVASKDRKAFHTQQQRAEILDSLTMVDEVLLLPSLKAYDDYFELVQKVNPEVIAYTEGDPQSSNKDRQAQDIGAQSIAFPFEEGFSTTDLLRRYRQN